MPLTKRQILVADDDVTYRELATDSLAHAGHRVTTACDGQEALELLSRRAFDIAMIDLDMPVVDGITIIETLRSSGLNAKIPIIVITGHDDAEAVDRAYRAGATSFLTKPLNWLLFTPHVEFVLRSSDTANELREATATLAFLSDLKSQMMAALAQEFQTPIRTIFGFSQLLDKEVYGPIAPASYKDMITDISKSAYGLNTALLKVMNFGRALTEHLQVKSEPVLAFEVLRASIAALADHAHSRDVRIIQSIDIPEQTVVHADPALLAQALRSVIENAIRLSPRGGKVTLSAAIDAHGALVFNVGDTGPALPQELVEEVNDTPRPYQGFLGQSPSSAVSIKIAKILTEAHSGTFAISACAKNGNVVSLTLPRQAQTTAAVTNAVTKLPPSSASERLARITAELSSDPRLKGKLGTSFSAGRLLGKVAAQH